ncbi:Oidioi.mRNA.OKI2018_I69.PAR.g9504.t1.cds [Oikopleura dioica]|uniref:Oidioi.mRNA.OKI2018_I69.PAR.g9504.t1.cds n=1 Tax=Oikopleura dioica TaxID=34765 RepID=A0ABN7RKY3_OIKDI|nr:Oidioi.mRNA.OKI2018_I69.PAR.g9504.t1.cds [Oikopleura dioica]
MQKSRSEDDSSSRTVYFIYHSRLSKIVNKLACPKCTNVGSFDVNFTKMNLLNFYIVISCSRCKKWTSGSWLLPDKFNEAFQAAKTCVGIVDAQINRFLALIGMSGKAKNGEERMPDFHHSSSTAQDLQNLVDGKIIELAKKSMLAARNSLVSEARKFKAKSMQVAVDGCYNDTGHKRNSAQACIVSVVAKVRGLWKIIGNKVVKKPQEISEEQLKAEGKGFIAPRGTVSSQLEKIGTHTVIKIACDKDAGIRDPKNTNVFVDEERSNQLMIPMNRYEFVDDRAHISKNIPGTVNRNFKTGSSEMRFTPLQKLEILSRLQRATEETMDKCSTGEWGLAEATAKMNKTRLHSYGDHSMCDSNCPGKPPIFQPHGAFTQEKIVSEVDAFFAAHFGEKFIESLVATGSSSPVEFYHALMIRRRLWVKGTHASVLSRRYEVAAAISTLIYNEGQDKAFKMMLEAVSYAVPEVGLERIEAQEKERKEKCEEKQKKKSKVENARRRNQKQYTEMGGYATQKQRDIENSRRIFEEKEEDLPEFDELLAMESSEDFDDYETTVVEI